MSKMGEGFAESRLCQLLVMLGSRVLGGVQDALPVKYVSQK